MAWHSYVLESLLCINHFCFAGCRWILATLTVPVIDQKRRNTMTLVLCVTHKVTVNSGHVHKVSSYKYAADAL